MVDVDVWATFGVDLSHLHTSQGYGIESSVMPAIVLLERPTALDLRASYRI